ncbi:TraR/DksA family transcriptional regulator [Alteromonas sp. 14N.309.X.WAT.G.H12]|uniref:TraR/DksA family transcriptional regulator n=1 Tax=Alteromonas sp. 14N.309.X.WAT.G.H12 TaxID=3120824 RepID=UPI002FD271AF
MDVLKDKLAASGEQEYMSPAQVAVFKQALFDEKSRLIASNKKSKDEEMEGVGERFSDPADEGQRITDALLRNSQEFNRTKRIRQIDRALLAIANEEYGFCEVCGEEIGLARLTVNPAALSDVHCSTVKEKKKAHFLSVAF